MTTEAQKILFSVEMEETYGGWEPVSSTDYEKIMGDLNKNSVSQYEIDDSVGYADIITYTFSDESVVIERTNRNAVKVFDHCI